MYRNIKNQRTNILEETNGNSQIFNYCGFILFYLFLEVIIMDILLAS